ncbi:MAG: hypothetical protein QXN93_05865 [Methanomassiliicoccales archaeon]
MAKEMITKEEIIRDVEEKLRSIPGIKDVLFLDETLKSKIIALEKKAEENGAVGGLMPFTNKGVWEALNREICIVIVIDKIAIPEIASDHRIYLIDQKNQIIGEYVSTAKQASLQKRDDVYFLSDDFVLYSDVEIQGEPYFLIPEMEFHGLDGIKHIKRVTSGSISTLSDYFIRCLTGHLEPKLWTHLIGFDIDEIVSR